jgi:phosphopantothenoylcysteine synthetase/decarboxylase
MKILITSGGTRIPIDSVRHIDNMSSGRSGRQLAIEALRRGHEVLFFTSKKGERLSVFKFDLSKSSYKDLEVFDLFYKSILYRYREVEYDTYQEYHDRLLDLISKESFDSIVLCAAVSDYTVDEQKGKISSSSGIDLKLIPTQKVLPKVKKSSPDSIVVGYKLLSGSTIEELELICRKQLMDNRIDMVVGNDLSALKQNKYFQLHLIRNLQKANLVTENFSTKIMEAIEGLL